SMNRTLPDSPSRPSTGASTTTEERTVSIDVANTSASQMGTQNAETLTGNNANDMLHGYAGNATLKGSGGSDLIFGDAGNDTIDGGSGADIIHGGAGSDSMTGGTGADVFAWSLGDKGTAGTPAVDVITDFNTATPAAGGDQLDLRDLLQGENFAGGLGNLGNYLHFTTVSGTTTIQISSSGAFAGGYSAS